MAWIEFMFRNGKRNRKHQNLRSQIARVISVVKNLVTEVIWTDIGSFIATPVKSDHSCNQWTDVTLVSETSVFTAYLVVPSSCYYGSCQQIWLCTRESVWNEWDCLGDTTTKASKLCEKFNNRLTLLGLHIAMCVAFCCKTFFAQQS